MNTLPLFPDAPEQAPDPQLRTDEHVLQPCDVCLGDGMVLWLPCLRCNGAGAVLSRVGRWRDG